MPRKKRRPPIPRQQQETSPVPSENQSPPTSPPTILPAPPPALAGHSPDGATEGGDAIDPATIPAPTGYDEAAGASATEPPAPGEASPPAAPAEGQTKPLTFEEWYSFVHAMSNAAAMKFQLRSLAWHRDRPDARAAFEALYETCSDIPALHFVISPGGKWGKRVACMAMFFLPLAMSLRAELEAKRRGAAPGAPAMDGEGEAAAASSEPTRDASGRVVVAAKAAPSSASSAPLLPAAFVSQLGKAP